GDIAAQQTFEQLSSPRTHTKHMERWPRNMPEGHDRAERQSRTQFAWREGEVIVLHEQQRRCAGRLVGNRSGEADVGSRVGAEITRSEHRLDTKGMTQRP